jgi:hypothetical protein
MELSQKDLSSKQVTDIFILNFEFKNGQPNFLLDHFVNCRY